MISDYFRLIRQSPKVLGLGFVYAFFSSYGQTFYISLSVPHLTEEFNFSPGQWGSLYSGVNVLSALCLPFLGSKLDQTPLAPYTRNVSFGLAAACLLLAVASHPLMIALALFGLRLTGQGLLSLMATATMARLFHQRRGKALSIATMGFPLGETVFPAFTVILIHHWGWRPTWGLAAAALILILYPLASYLIRNGDLSLGKDHPSSPLAALSWNRRQVLGHWQFYTLIPTYIAPGFLATGLILYQFSLADEKGWSHTLMASSFVCFGLGRLVFAFLTGPFIDRFSARQLFSLQLIPLAVAMVILARFQHPLSAFLYNGLIGISLGIGSSTSSALWAELYGTRHLGAIKSLMSTIGITCTALSPILVGTLLDRAVGFETQSGYYFAALIGFALLSRLGCASIRPLSNRSITQPIVTPTSPLSDQRPPPGPIVNPKPLSSSSK